MWIHREVILAKQRPPVGVNGAFKCAFQETNDCVTLTHESKQLGNLMKSRRDDEKPMKSFISIFNSQ